MSRDHRCWRDVITRRFLRWNVGTDGRDRVGMVAFFALGRRKDDAIWSPDGSSVSVNDATGHPLSEPVGI
jgi:hypothetical protein